MTKEYTIFCLCLSHITDPFFALVFCKHNPAVRGNVSMMFRFIAGMADNLGVQAAHEQRHASKKPDVPHPARTELESAWSVVYKTLRENGYDKKANHDFGHMLWYGMMLLVCICTCEQDNLVPLLQELKSRDGDFRPMQGLGLLLCYNLRPEVCCNFLPSSDPNVRGRF